MQIFQSLFDEREDLVQERDAYKCKVHRLNHSMSALLKSDSHKYIDLDCILSENRYLKDSLEQVKQEKHLANEMGRKYKAALEQNSKPKSLRWGLDIEFETLIHDFPFAVMTRAPTRK